RIHLERWSLRLGLDERRTRSGIGHDPDREDRIVCRCGVIASAILAVLTLLSFSILKTRANQQYTIEATNALRRDVQALVASQPLASSGISSIHDDFPVNLFNQKCHLATTEVRILGSWIYSRDPISNDLIATIRRGVPVKILLMKPSSAIAEQRLKDLAGQQDLNDLKSSFNQLMRIVVGNELLKYQLEIRLYDAIPPFRLHQVDDWFLLGIFWAEAFATNAPQLEFSHTDSMFAKYAVESFDRIWDKSTVINTATGITEVESFF
ncbi:MAG: hypothetical protein F6K11_15010, partial [Leptolyngbya sp. SIO3F4]|nr:hypothetical protein [Leptolyngbya sp. SIO3F4]